MDKISRNHFGKGRVCSEVRRTVSESPKSELSHQGSHHLCGIPVSHSSPRDVLPSDYRPECEAEGKDHAEFCGLAERDPGGAFLRGAEGHLTASAFILDRAGENVLLIKHKIFGDYCAPGGHADGEKNPLVTALREAKEETGADCYPVTVYPAAFDALPVKKHLRRGVEVAGHTHYCFTFLCITEAQEFPFSALEVDDARFVPREELATWVTAPNLLAIYLKCLEYFDKVTAEKKDSFRSLPKLLLPWFEKEKRDLPWRHARTPYRVWLAEIMLQQTRVEAVKAYYTRFLAEVPDIVALASLPEERLMKLWEGLGYYARMRNLKAAAKAVVGLYSGEFPHTAAELKTLPGIGEYTAGAIASIAFHEKSAAVDGNVIRVVSRLTEDYQNTGADSYRKELSLRLSEIYPDGSEGDFTESLMELGATVCLPNGEPLCEVCPLKLVCFARKNGVQNSLPIKRAKAARKTEYYTVFLITRGCAVAVEKRSGKGVLSGMWQFPNVRGTIAEKDAEIYLKERGFAVQKVCTAGDAEHIFTHLIWKMQIMTAGVPESASGLENVRFVTEDELSNEVSLPSAFRKVLHFHA